jgi:hypothetical protein
MSLTNRELISTEVSNLSARSRSHRVAEVNRKTDQIRAAWAAGDQIRALRIAARFFDRTATNPLLPIHRLEAPASKCMRAFADRVTGFSRNHL